MFHAHLLIGYAFNEACAGEDVDEFLDRSKSRYLEFAHTRLLQRVGSDASTSQAPARAPNSQVSFHSVKYMANGSLILLSHFSFISSHLLGQLSLILGLVPWRGHNSIPGLYLVERGPLLASLRVLAVPLALAPRHC